MTELPGWFLRWFRKIFLFEFLCINFFGLGCEFLVVTKDGRLLCFTLKGSFFAWLISTYEKSELKGSKFCIQNEPRPESFTFFESWNPTFDWWNCSDLEIRGNDWSPSEHRIGIWIIENIIRLHFLMNDFCKSFHIFSLLRFHY